jgi:hypothetical protein
MSDALTSPGPNSSKTYHASVLRVVFRDWLSCICALHLAIGAFVCVAYLTARSGDGQREPGDWVLPLFFLATGIPAGVALLVRVWLIHRLFARGVVLPARIVRVGESEDEFTGPTVDVAYRYRGRYYRTREVTLFGPGGGKRWTYDQSVEVVVDPARPWRAVLVEAYFRAAKS